MQGILNGNHLSQNDLEYLFTEYPELESVLPNFDGAVVEPRISNRSVIPWFPSGKWSALGFSDHLT